MNADRRAAITKAAASADVRPLRKNLGAINVQLAEQGQTELSVAEYDDYLSGVVEPLAGRHAFDPNELRGFRHDPRMTKERHDIIQKAADLCNVPPKVEHIAVINYWLTERNHSPVTVAEMDEYNGVLPEVTVSEAEQARLRRIQAKHDAQHPAPKPHPKPRRPVVVPVDDEEIDA